MKRLYMIGGTMGVGKSTVCRLMQRQLSRCVLLDGDWCWDMRPFLATPETKAMVVDNICHLLNNFLACSCYETILFCWVLDEQATWDEILSRLDLSHCETREFALIAEAETIRARLRQDMDSGVREENSLVIRHSLEKLPHYAQLRCPLLDVTELTPAEAAQRLLEMGGLK